MKARTNLIATIAVGAALFVPVAQAQSPDDQAGPRGPGGIAAQQAGSASNHPDNRAVHGPGATPYDWRDYVSSYGAISHPDNRVDRGPGSIARIGVIGEVRPDDRAGARGPGALGSVTIAGAVGHPDNRTGTRGPGSVDKVVVATASTGFDWGDAFIGSLGGLGTALLLTGGVILLASQRNKARLA